MKVTTPDSDIAKPVFHVAREQPLRSTGHIAHAVRLQFPGKSTSSASRDEGAPSRRFKTCTARVRPLALSGSSLRRNAAGDSDCTALNGRNTTAQELPASATSCKRRKVVKSACASHASTAPQVPARSACSTARKASCRADGCTNNTRDKSTPACANAGTLGICGGATKASQRFWRVICANAGNNKLTSPMPARAIRISVSDSCGQPLPPSAASSALCPEGNPPLAVDGAAAPCPFGAGCMIFCRCNSAMCIIVVCSCESDRR